MIKNNFLVLDKDCKSINCNYKSRNNDYCYRCRRKLQNKVKNEIIEVKNINQSINYINKVELTVILKENPKIIEFSQKIAASSIPIKVINAQAHWAGLNFTTLSVYDYKIQKKFLKLKERDIVFVKGKIHNRYYPNKSNNKTYFSIEILDFEKVGKKRKNNL